MKIVTLKTIKKRGKGREMSDIDEGRDLKTSRRRERGEK